MMGEKSVLNNQKGFTLLDSIFSMFILTIIMSVIPLIIQSFSAIDQAISVEEDFEWNLFLIDFRSELVEAEKVRVYSNRILIDKNNFLTIYETYGDSIRRTFNNKGHEIVLQYVPSVKFSQIDQMLLLHVVFSNGVKEEARFVIPPEKEETNDEG
ncbi:competence type IV pilus minor pilin ComGF [Lederbergia panacisoli]|uniref:competence type IV pilus minor pilin ComGF n=1 Tax=Lederbergia panacisoli TaxID=1255251 RepID=UPI00214CF35A|nr:competence type IV pilus minor pilin ComGF [Lederbergia panacisoli]MCR2820381.1 competence type IV pilus minor pilin ComGF [Lederbergia panacisoli]